jgi:hypothetical protein
VVFAALIAVDFDDRVIRAVTDPNRMTEKLAKHRASQVRHARRLGADVPDVGGDLGAWHVVHHAMAVQLAEAVENDAVDPLRIRLEVRERRAL